MSTQAINDLAVLLKELTKATDALDVKGRELAERERDYRATLSKALLIGRAEGYPVTILRDICLGRSDVSEARFRRDIAQAQYDATRERINTLKLHARMIDGQLSRDLELAGEGYMIKLIPTGAENAILLKDLAAMTGKSPRTVQADVQLLRDHGFVILSSAAGGYYFPTTDEKGVSEVRQYIAMMESQALGRLKRLGAVKKWLKEHGQMRIKDVEEKMNKTIHDAIFSRDYWAEVDHYFDDGEMFLICGDCSAGISYGDLYCSHCGKYLSYKKVNPIFLKLWKDEAMSAFIEKKSKRTQLLLQPSVHEAIRRLAEEEETSFNDYVNTLLKEHASKVLGEINS